jgi:hypothetical protein
MSFFQKTSPCKQGIPRRASGARRALPRNWKWRGTRENVISPIKTNTSGRCATSEVPLRCVAVQPPKHLTIACSRQGKPETLGVGENP